MSSQNDAYYKLTNTAELDIVRGNYSSALENYNQAFSISEKPKTIDIVNSLKCSCLIKSPIQENVIKKLYQRGLTYKDLNKDKVLKNCLKDYKRLEEVDFAYDTEYRAAINKIDDDDQVLRITHGSYKQYRKEIDSIDEQNVSNLREWIVTKGFPSESKIGVESISGWQGWKIVVLHYQQQRSVNTSKPDLFSEVLLSALKNDDITPLQYSEYIEIQNDPKYLKYKSNPLVMLKMGQYRIGNSTLENLETVNKARADISLYALKDYAEKIIFQDKNPHDFNFGINGGYVDLTSQSKDLKKKFKDITVALDLEKL